MTDVRDDWIWLVREALRRIPRPGEFDVTDQVFCQIQHDNDLEKVYKAGFDSNSDMPKRVINTTIPKIIVQETGMHASSSHGPKAATSDLIESYTPLYPGVKGT